VRYEPLAPPVHACVRACVRAYVRESAGVRERVRVCLCLFVPTGAAGQCVHTKHGRAARCRTLRGKRACVHDALRCRAEIGLGGRVRANRGHWSGHVTVTIQAQAATGHVGPGGGGGGGGGGGVQSWRSERGGPQRDRAIPA